VPAASSIDPAKKYGGAHKTRNPNPQLTIRIPKSTRTNKEFVAPPSEREKKQKKRVNLKTANGS
jgi:hypothetical protein